MRLISNRSDFAVAEIWEIIATSPVRPPGLPQKSMFGPTLSLVIRETPAERCRTLCNAKSLLRRG